MAPYRLTPSITSRRYRRVVGGRLVLMIVVFITVLVVALSLVAFRPREGGTTTVHYLASNHPLRQLRPRTGSSAKSPVDSASRAPTQQPAYYAHRVSQWGPRVYLDRSSRVELRDEDRTLAFVHIGKAGGSTISAQLRNGCHEYLNQKPCHGRDGTIPNETVASFRIQSYFHLVAVPFDRFTSFVVTVRNPLRRMASAFLANHPINVNQRRFQWKQERNQAIKEGRDHPHPVGMDRRGPEREAVYGCFPTLESFADAAAGRPKVEMAYGKFEGKRAKNPKKMEFRLNCTKVAQGAIAGADDRMEHLYWNYRAYVGELPPTKEVFVLRQEHLTEDWNSVNRMLGQTKKAVLPAETGRMRRDKEMPIQYKLSPDGARTLCKLLRDEIRVYVKLLNRAVNLSDYDVKLAIEDVKSSCLDFKN